MRIAAPRAGGSAPVSRAPLRYGPCSGRRRCFPRREAAPAWGRPPDSGRDARIRMARPCAGSTNPREPVARPVRADVADRDRHERGDRTRARAVSRRRDHGDRLRGAPAPAEGVGRRPPPLRDRGRPDEADGHPGGAPRECSRHRARRVPRSFAGGRARAGGGAGGARAHAHARARARGDGTFADAGTGAARDADTRDRAGAGAHARTAPRRSRAASSGRRRS